MSSREVRRVYYERREELRQMPKNAFIFLGPPTSGKTTQSLFLSETIKGKILHGRDIVPELSSALESSRTLVDDALFVPSLRDFLYREVSPNLVLDNIPRTQLQAGAILKWSQENNVVLHVVAFRLTKEEVLKRSARRIVCPQCGESYSPELKPPKVADKCDRDGTKLLPRPGDKPELLSEVFA